MGSPWSITAYLLFLGTVHYYDECCCNQYHIERLQRQHGPVVYISKFVGVVYQTVARFPARFLEQYTGHVDQRPPHHWTGDVSWVIGKKEGKIYNVIE